MAFPSSPTNGQQVTVNGVVYTYNSTTTTWNRSLAAGTSNGSFNALTANTLSVTNIYGEFKDNVVIIGATSNAQYSLGSYDPLKDSVRNETYDNQYIELKGNNYIDTTESNPIGNL